MNSHPWVLADIAAFDQRFTCSMDCTLTRTCCMQHTCLACSAVLAPSRPLLTAHCLAASPTSILQHDCLLLRLEVTLPATMLQWQYAQDVPHHRSLQLPTRRFHEVCWFIFKVREDGASLLIQWQPVDGNVVCNAISYTSIPDA